MKIGLDFGGVVANHIPIKIEEARVLWGIDLSLRDNAALRSELLAHVGEEEYRRLVHRIGLRTADFPLHDDAHDVLWRLTKQGHTFAVVTTQIAANEQMIRDYLTAHHLPVDEICVTTADEGKIGGCRQSGVQAFFDDTVEVLESLEPLAAPLIWANFYGDNDARGKRFRIAHSWKEFELLALASL